MKVSKKKSNLYFKIYQDYYDDIHAAYISALIEHGLSPKRVRAVCKGVIKVRRRADKAMGALRIDRVAREVGWGHA